MWMVEREDADGVKRMWWREDMWMMVKIGYYEMVERGDGDDGMRK